MTAISKRQTTTEITLAVVGAGGRGSTYARRAQKIPGVRVVAIAEFDEARRNRVGDELGIPAEMRFSDWESFAAIDRVSDGVIIGTQDSMHRAPAVALAAKGYHIMLEKPMAPTEEDAIAIVEAAEQNNVMMMICHTLRYTQYTRRVKELIDSGIIGEIVTVEHLEPIAFYHYAHAWVRGPWRKEADSAPLLMTKSCHDIDWLSFIIGRKAQRVSSFGSLYEFKHSRRPEGATDRCLDCPLINSCAYSAPNFYLPLIEKPRGLETWLQHMTEDITVEGVTKALREGPFGKCVWASDNDVVDHQVVNIEYEGGVTASFTMTAFNEGAARKTRIFGTKGYLETNSAKIELFDFLTQTTTVEEIELEDDPEELGGHMGGDEGLINAFVDALKSGDPAVIASDARTSLATHQIVWAAEVARKQGVVVEMPTA